MANAATTEIHPVSKTRKPKTPEPSPPDDELGRIELQAPVKWIAQIDAAAAKLGLSRSAFIRLACNRLMQAERKEDA